MLRFIALFLSNNRYKMFTMKCIPTKNLNRTRAQMVSRSLFKPMGAIVNKKIKKKTMKTN